jgi:hypothetical protein
MPIYTKMTKRFRTIPIHTTNIDTFIASIHVAVLSPPPQQQFRALQPCSCYFELVALSCWKKQHTKELVIRKDESPLHRGNLINKKILEINKTPQYNHGPSYCSLKNKADYADRHIQSTKGAQ